MRALLFVSILVLAIHLGAQQSASRPPDSSRVTIELPDGVASEKVWIDYLVGSESGGHADLVRAQKNVRQYVIETDSSMRYIKIVVYSPGCQFKIYERDLNSSSDVSETFECVPLPQKIIRGVLPVDEIPAPRHLPLIKRLSISGGLSALWVCDYFFKAYRGMGGGGGSLGVFTIPLGNVGEIDPSDGGSFQVEVPDFTRDPVFQTFGGKNSRFGAFQLSFREKAGEHPLGSIVPKDDSDHVQGLMVEEEYREPIVFTTRR